MVLRFSAGGDRDQQFDELAGGAQWFSEMVATFGPLLIILRTARSGSARWWRRLARC
jgi:hypothetical protein